MKFYTGYFARIKKYETMNLFPVSIARFSPKGTNFMSFPSVMPDEKLLRDYKYNGLSEDGYKERYIRQLERIDIPKELHAIEDKIPDSYDGIVLCCYEKPDGFCHRHILADYVKEHFGIEMTEVML